MPGPKKTRAQLKQAGIGGIYGTYRQPPEEPSATPTPEWSKPRLETNPSRGMMPTPTPTPATLFDNMRSFLDRYDRVIKALGGK